VANADRHEPSGILAGVRERFAASTDFTIGIEEEYQLLDPESLALVNRFDDVFGAAEGSLAERLAGELIASEIEYRTVKHDTFATAARELAEGRLATIALAQSRGVGVGISGVHPFSTWPDQKIIDTPHYRLVEGGLGYVAWTNNTWSIHLHCGVRDADRAIAVSSAMRSVLPQLLALSANSAIFWSRATRLHSTRTQVFAKSFPRCYVPDAFASWDEYGDFVQLLERTNSIEESTQIWWSIRPHHSFGTIEVRICDGQSEMHEAVALAALATACIAQFCRDYDAGIALPMPAGRFIEENMWRAIRHGITGNMIDFERGVEIPTPVAIERLLDWTAPTHAPLGLGDFLTTIPQTLAEGNGAVRQLRRLEALSGDVRAVHSEVMERTAQSAREFLSRVDKAVAA
jgi:carboxylate-amine ligase